ncbi:hypothetical protein FDB39_03300 [Clostridium botulinum]|nr:hypothetical protein [Clostridium botulinum]
MEENKIQVYIKTDKNNCIVNIESTISNIDFIDWIYIDEGIGQKYSHAQNYYLDKSLMDNQGRCNYKYEEGTVIELTDEEKKILYPPVAQQPNQQEILQKQLLETQNLALELQYKLTNKDLEIK